MLFSKNDNGPHRPIGRGTVRRCGHVGVGVAWRKKCVTVEVGFEILFLTVWKPVFSQLTLEQELELSASQCHVCLHSAMLPTIMIMD